MIFSLMFKLFIDDSIQIFFLVFPMHLKNILMKYYNSFVFNRKYQAKHNTLKKVIYFR